MPLLRQAARKALTVVQEIDGAGRVFGSWGGQRSLAGTDVTPEGSLGLVAVYSATDLLASMIGSLPTQINTTDRRFEPLRPSQYPALWGPMANPAMTQQAEKEIVATSLLLWGEAFEGCVYNNRGDLIALWPIHPENVSEVKVSADGTVTYHVWRGGSQREYVVPAGDPRPAILHTPGRMLPGATRGMSPIGYAMQQIGLGHAIERTAAAFYRNGMNPQGVITAKGHVKDSVARELAKRVHDSYGGADKAGKWVVIGGEATIAPITVPPIQAQFVEQQRLSDRKVASLYRVPPHLISDVDASTSWGTGIEEQTIGFLTFSALPWVKRIEQGRERLMAANGYQYRHKMQGLLRGSHKARNEAYSIGRNGGWYSVNDIREWEDLPPVEGGDTYLQPLNMQAVGDEELAA